MININDLVQSVGDLCAGGAFERLAGVVDGLGALADPDNRLVSRRARARIFGSR